MNKIRNILKKVPFLVRIKRLITREKMSSISLFDLKEIEASKNNNKHKIVLVGHNGGTGGAEVLLENIAKKLISNSIDVVILTRGDGPIIKSYREIAPTYVVDNYEIVKDILKKLKANNYKTVILNTVVNGDLVKLFNKNGYHTMSLIHELPGVIKELKVEQRAKEISGHSNLIVFPSTYVYSKFTNIFNVKKPYVIKSQGLYMKHSNYKCENGKKYLKEKYDIDESKIIVLNAGVGEKRKGIDLFINMAKKCKDEKVHFVWVGELSNEIKKKFNKDITKLTNLTMVGFVSDKEQFLKFYEGCDIFALTSREDPFPSVVLEALNAAIPVVAFGNAGGFVDVVKNDKTGYLIEYERDDLMLEKIIYLAYDLEKRKKLGKNAKNVCKDYSFDNYIKFLIEKSRGI